uniref:Uncharacterized protein n=1 Tax=Cannabis sativa TaxID=3483 RepID=A0A803PS05_CANSA
MGPKKDVLNGMDNHFGVVQTVVNRQLGELCSTFDQKFEFVSGQLAMVLQALTDLHPPSKTMRLDLQSQTLFVAQSSLRCPHIRGDDDSIDGDASHGSRWNTNDVPFHHGPLLNIFCRCSLRPFRLGTTTEEFLFGTQEALVKDYLIYWESLASRVSSIPKHILEGNFVKGLKDEINSVDSLTAFCFFLSSK